MSFKLKCEIDLALIRKQITIRKREKRRTTRQYKTQVIPQETYKNKLTLVGKGLN